MSAPKHRIFDLATCPVCGETIRAEMDVSVVPNRGEGDVHVSLNNFHVSHSCGIDGKADQ